MPEAKNKVAAASQMIYFFALGDCEGDPSRKDILGGKGASLIAMSAAGLPVPPGFTISIPCCQHYHDNGGKWAAGLEEELRRYLARLEKATGKKFGQGQQPLLVSVRSGAAASMPGMMDTILNCGLHPGLADEMPDKTQFWTVYAAFVEQFAKTVAGLPAEKFEEAAKGIAAGQQHAQQLAQSYMKLYERETKAKFPLTAWDALCECINCVFNSWNNERAKIYRKAHGLEHLMGTAVTVQSMFNSDVSGIAFTANPSNPAADEIIIESSYGLGESIVSGDVTPDRFVLNRQSLAVKEKVLGNKDHAMYGLGRSSDSPDLDPSVSSLTDQQVQDLAHLAVKVEDYFGFPVDIEWGISNGTMNLLQSRAIRGLDVARDVEVGRREEIARLTKMAAASGASGKKSFVWIVHNLAETLETPTPLTWDIIRGFMSGNGGFGVMYKDFGYRPTRRVCEEGFLELICGRMYADTDRTAELFWEGMPYQYDHEEVLADPRVLEAAPKKFDANRADEKFLLRVPGTVVAMIKCSRITKRARRNAITEFEQNVLPPYRQYVEEKRRQDLSKLSTAEVIQEVRDRVERVLTDFGKESLKPGFFGGGARAELENKLIQLLGCLEGANLCQVLTSGLEGDTTVEQNAMLFDVGQGQARMDTFVDLYGHRAVDEMELAKPRWREDASYLQQIVDRQRKKSSTAQSPAALHKKNREKREQAMRDLPDVLARCGGSFMKEELEALAIECQDLLPYRETGKHYLLMGYEVIRMGLLELARRWDLGDDVFFLHLEELSQFEADAERLTKELGKRKIRWQSFQRLDLPDVINSAELEQLGLPRQLAAATEMNALSLSAGVVTGTARIIYHPGDADDLGDDCILICPSTDPSWTALFTTIKGLIVERGGVLSHGAITARDFSIPAVACPNATLTIKDGTKVRVDGDRGHVTVIKD